MTDNKFSVDENGTITATNLILGNQDVTCVKTGSTVGDKNQPNYIQADYFKVTNDQFGNNIADVDLYIGTNAMFGIVDPSQNNSEIEIYYAGITGTIINRTTKRRQDVMSGDNRGFFSLSGITKDPNFNDPDYTYKFIFDTNSGYGYGAFYFRPTSVKKENLGNLSQGDSLNAFKKGGLIAVSNWYSNDDNFVTYVMYNGNDINNITQDDFTAITTNLNLPNSNFLQDEVPTSATSPGTKGATAFDRNYMYHCYADNQWTRFARDLSW